LGEGAKKPPASDGLSASEITYPIYLPYLPVWLKHSKSRLSTPTPVHPDYLHTPLQKLPVMCNSEYNLYT